MKTNLIITLALAAGIALANAETWTSSDGRSASMTLIEVIEKDGEKAGKFRLPGGKIVTLEASRLSEESAKRLDEWVDPNKPAAPESVFDDILDGNLERLDGNSLKKCEDATKPKKLYVFYYTASWCGPCQQFTPSLVKWYEDNKNDNFELVLITSDQDEGSMEKYAKDKKMPWPHLKMRKADDFKKEFKHGVSGIPSVMVCDIDGKLLGNYRSRLPELTEMVKD